MTQEKMRKVITAGVAAATMLVVFLFAFLMYQWIVIAVKDYRIDKITKENAQYQEQIDKNASDAEYYESLRGKEWLAFQSGFIRP